MLFNSFAFLGFFALVALLHYLVPPKHRWVALLLASYYFYSTFDPRYLLLLGFATLVAYAAGLALAARGRGGGRGGGGRAVVAAAVVAELAVLAVFKYLDFLFDSLEGALGGLGVVSGTLALPRLEFLLPAGLSFYTFSCISYVVDVYRGTVEAERHLGKLAVYVSFFPKLLAGPIERAGTFLAQLEAPARFEWDRVSWGLQLMLWGLFKKVVIADRLAAFVDAGFGSPGFQSPVTLLVATYFYAFQIYCDFSGYSDIAIGAAAVLGFRLMENFRRPYLATSVPEFWNARWHLSLMLWFRDYLYIPLGGRRVSRPRWYLNQMIVFLVSGLWHGANWTFVVWGGLNGLYQVVYYALAGTGRRLARVVALPSSILTPLSVLLTFHLITLSWVFFRADTLGDAFTVLGRIAGALPQMPSLLVSYGWTADFWLSVSLIGLLMTVELIEERKPLHQRLSTRPVALRWAWYYGLLASLLVIGVWSQKQFVYMQF